MSPAQPGQSVQPAAHDTSSKAAIIQRVPSSPARHDNDNAEQAGAVDELVRSRQRIWQSLARWLIIGGLLWAFGLIALLAFIYSRYP
jgi:hypothetical protein